MRPGNLGLVPLLVIALAGCSTAPASSAGPSPTTATTPTPVPSPSSSARVVTFEVAGKERFKVQLVDPADIAIAEALASGARESAIPNGRIVYGDAAVNIGYTWHLDPLDFEFADFTTEVCDGLPSDVEGRRLTSERFCPWGAKLVEIGPG